LGGGGRWFTALEKSLEIVGEIGGGLVAAISLDIARIRSVEPVASAAFWRQPPKLRAESLPGHGTSLTSALGQDR
jgi:hypothetical protein